MTTSTQTFDTSAPSTLDYHGTTITLVVSGSTLCATMDDDASERWGAHLEPGVEAADLGEYRRGLRSLLRRAASRLELRLVDVYAVQEDAQDWMVDQFKGFEGLDAIGPWAWPTQGDAGVRPEHAVLGGDNPKEDRICRTIEVGDIVGGSRLPYPGFEG